MCGSRVTYFKLNHDGQLFVSPKLPGALNTIVIYGSHFDHDSIRFSVSAFGKIIFGKFQITFKTPDRIEASFLAFGDPLENVALSVRVFRALGQVVHEVKVAAGEEMVSSGSMSSAAPNPTSFVLNQGLTHQGDLLVGTAWTSNTIAITGTGFGSVTFSCQDPSGRYDFGGYNVQMQASQSLSGVFLARQHALAVVEPDLEDGVEIILTVTNNNYQAGYCTSVVPVEA